MLKYRRVHVERMDRQLLIARVVAAGNSPPGNIVRCHHPHVALFMAPRYDQCLTLCPTLQIAKGSHPAYLSLFE
jgi:hypothetical protein